MSDWTLDDALDDTPWTDDPIAHITPTEPPEQPNTPLYTPGSPQHRAHLGALIATALQAEPSVPLPTQNDINTAYHAHRIIATRNYAAQAYSKTTLKALGDSISVGHIQGARFYDENFDEIPTRGLMQVIEPTFNKYRPDESTELDRREAVDDARAAYKKAKLAHTDVFNDPDATIRDKLQATLELKMAQTRLTELTRYRPT